MTGSSISNIDGLLKANGSANLFLLNPNGIIFGSGAELNIGGSFVGSTASAVKFADGNQFSATAPQTTSLLTVSVPLGLQFGPTAGNIINQSRATNTIGEPVGLQVQPGKTLALVGGNVRLEGATMLAPGGRVELGGVWGSFTLEFVDSGNLGLSFPDSIAFADVVLTKGTFVSVAALGSGSIAINARNIDVLEGSYLFAGIDSGLGSRTAVAGDVTLNATGTIALKQSSNIINEVSPNATGNSGNIDMKAESLDFENAFLSTRTFGQGDAGNVIINARGSVSFDNSVAGSTLEEDAVGKGGNIQISADSLSLTNGVRLTTDTDGLGNAGNLIINVRKSVSFDNGSALSTVEPNGVGKGGDIRISADSLSLTNGAQLTASTRGQGDAGYIEIHAKNSASVSGINSSRGDSSALLTSTLSDSTGKGGNIIVNTPILRVSDGGVLDARTNNNRNGGNITLNVRQAEILNGGQLISTSSSAGNAGTITVNATDRVIVNSSDRAFNDRVTQFNTNVDPIDAFSGLFVRSQSTGSAGNIEITASQILLDNTGTVSAESESGNGGNINLKVADLLLLRRGSEISTSAGTARTGGNGTRPEQ